MLKAIYIVPLTRFASECWCVVSVSTENRLILAKNETTNPNDRYEKLRSSCREVELGRSRYTRLHGPSNVYPHRIAIERELVGWAGDVSHVRCGLPAGVRRVGATRTSRRTSGVRRGCFFV